MTIFLSMDTSTTEIYTLSLHDALPISHEYISDILDIPMPLEVICIITFGKKEKEKSFADTNTLHWEKVHIRSEEHTSELQSRPHLVCRLLLEKKKNERTDISLRG